MQIISIKIEQMDHEFQRLSIACEKRCLPVLIRMALRIEYREIKALPETDPPEYSVPIYQTRRSPC